MLIQRRADDCDVGSELLKKLGQCHFDSLFVVGFKMIMVFMMSVCYIAPPPHPSHPGTRPGGRTIITGAFEVTRKIITKITGESRAIENIERLSLICVIMVLFAGVAYAAARACRACRSATVCQSTRPSVRSSIKRKTMRKDVLPEFF